MQPKLVLIEGLPGFGKTTTAQLVHDILIDMNINTQLFLEGNLDHPADYDGVACFGEYEYQELLRDHAEFSDLLRTRLMKHGNHYFLEYRKLMNEVGASIPKELIDNIFQYDIYELPIDQNRVRIMEKWEQFAKHSLHGTDTYVFDCCFIQNPVTIGMIKHGAANEVVISYVKQLASIVEQLNPLLLYVEQDDLDHSFRRAVKERPATWSEGFIEYYTNQGFGLDHGYHGLEGTLQVLKARRELEENIFNDLGIAKEKVNNSSYDVDAYKQRLVKILAAHFSENMS
ncbi:hypothetical protein ASD24_26500 [Paenibacillus sp. Root52]|uniref:hypothetical protein n=1 Tax=Paenibacillus sp. Root52 TaxID=1736552 RepID=UPI0006F9A3C6|nr:hypothetical protein [Paenibacillus sp. Root52]KQY88006.1 hypothetical protein ASD24_26500 [Paenibacillus sp. Root52]